MFRRTAPFLVIALILALPALNAMGALDAAQRPVRARPGRRPARRRRSPSRSAAEPPFVATPRAKCGPGSKPEPGDPGPRPRRLGDERAALQRRRWSPTRAPRAASRCCATSTPPGHECAFYDTALLFPINALNLDASSAGVAVLDMSDPAHPVQTDTLTEPPMLSPHESLNLNPKRGLLAAVDRQPGDLPGLVSIYDAQQGLPPPGAAVDAAARAPRPRERLLARTARRSTRPAPATKSITAIDVTDPKNPHAVWQGNVASHGMSLSDDGNRAYIADPTGGNMLILDTSQIQARKPNPQAREISRLTWNVGLDPAERDPVHRARPSLRARVRRVHAGHDRRRATRTPSAPGGSSTSPTRRTPRGRQPAPAGRPARRPRRRRPATPARSARSQGYAAHYCNIPTRVDPKVVACSFIASGLRVFDISDLAAPEGDRLLRRADAAASRERLHGERLRDVASPRSRPRGARSGTRDGASGFYVVRVARDVWPGAAGSTTGSGAGSRGCLAVGRRGVRRHGIGKVRLGMTRKALHRRLPAPRRKTKRAWRWCVRGGAYSRRSPGLECAPPQRGWPGCAGRRA